MKWPDLLRSAMLGLLQHKLRTLLTLCGVTLGSLLLFCSVAGGIGVIHTVNDRLGIGDRLMEVVVSSGYIVDSVSVDQAREAGFTEEMSDERRVRMATASGIGGRRHVPLNIASAQQLESLDHVEGVWPRIEFSSAMYLDAAARWMNASVRAVTPNRDLSEFVLAGDVFSSVDANEVIVSELFLYHLGVKSDAALRQAIGSKVRFVPNSGALVTHANRLWAIEMNKSLDEDAKATQREVLQQKVDEELERAKYKTDEFEIVGVLRALTSEEARFHPQVAHMSRGVLMPHQPAREIWERLNSPTRKVQAVVRADKPENVGRVEAAISELGYRTTSMAELALQIRSAVMLITAIITAIALASLFISGIGITNTMVMNVLERRREIAIMKSIGAQDSDIQRIFLVEGMLIGILGGFAGLALGRLFCDLTSDYIRQLLEWRLKLPFGDEIFAFPWWLLLLTPFVAALVTTIASVLPARQAARVDPVATLRAL